MNTLPWLLSVLATMVLKSWRIPKILSPLGISRKLVPWVWPFYDWYLIIVINQITRNLCSNPAGTDLLLQTATSQGPLGCVAVPLDESKGKQRGGVLGINDKTACLQVIATILTFCYAGNSMQKSKKMWLMSCIHHSL
jgi:hypothetical protein